MPNNSDRGEPVEKQRVCPSCRMLISILATKCRYCGEEVGKPKDETRELTAEDLGGETIYHRAPSGSVMDALESFRVEETSAIKREFETPSPKKKSLMKRGTAEPQAAGARDSSFPTLNSASRELADAVLAPATSGRTSSVRSRYARTPKETGIVIGAWVVGAIAILFGGIKGVGMFQDYQARQEAAKVEVYVNRAPAMMQQNAASIEILEAAAEAVTQEPSSENRRIAEEALALIVAEFNGLLNPERSDPPQTWSMEQISTASRLADRAAALYPNEATARLKEEADRELGYYRMVMTGGTDGVAIFKLNYPSAKTITVRSEENIDGRFIVKGMSGNEAKLQDIQRRDRRGRPRELTFQIGGSKPH